MFGKKTEKELPPTEEEVLKDQFFTIPWSCLFEGTPTGGIFAKLFPYIATALLFLILVITAIKK